VVIRSKDELAKATPDQRDALKQSVKDLSDKAAAEFEAAQKTASDKDPNQHLLWAKLGEAKASAKVSASRAAAVILIGFRKTPSRNIFPTARYIVLKLRAEKAKRYFHPRMLVMRSGAWP